MKNTAYTGDTQRLPVLHHTTSDDDQADYYRLYWARQRVEEARRYLDAAAELLQARARYQRLLEDSQQPLDLPESVQQVLRETCNA